MNQISVVILTKNNENTIGYTLQSVRQFEEVLILDSGSTDRTLEIAEKFTNVRIYRKDFTTFGDMRNFGAKHAQFDWILMLDSDEVVTSGLRKELLYTQLEDGVYYAIPSRNFIGKKEIKYSGWSPDYKNRLYNRTQTAFKNQAVHEDLLTLGLTKKTLTYPFLHTTYASVDEMVTKMNTYSTLFAKENTSKQSSLVKALVRSYWAFFKVYIIQRGFLDGLEGYLIALTQSQTTFYKYVKQMQRMQRMDAEDLITHVLEEDETLDHIAKEEADHKEPAPSK